MLLASTGCVYQITNLGVAVPGTPAAGAVSEAYAINNDGKPGTVAGVFRDATGFDRGIVWQRGTTGIWTGTSISTLEGPDSSAERAFVSFARAISEPIGSPGRAWVAGFSSDLFQPEGSAAPREYVRGVFFNVRNGDLANLAAYGIPPSDFAANSHALGIARYGSTGFIYGVGWREQPNGQRHAFVVGLNNPDCALNLGTLAGSQGSSMACAINSGREIVGWSTTAEGEIHAVRWMPRPGDGETIPCPEYFLRDLGPAGTHSEALALSGGGGIVGFVKNAGGTENAAIFRRSGSSGDGTVVILENPEGHNSRALGVNNSGTVVGWTEAPGGQRRAVLWRNGRRTDLTLNSRESINWGWGAPSWVLLEARGINEQGVIVGVGLRNGEMRAFLVEPPAFGAP